MYRVGMFNDGYLGTQYDYGTWGADCNTSICREEGVAWLEKYGINTPYGGEALTTAGGYEVINTPEFLSYEGFRTHTSYLNIQWNNNLIDSWKKTLFNIKDFDYDFERVDSLTGFKYINDHLGYRFVLREAWITDTVGADGIFKAKVRIQNVGFGNLTRKMSASLEIVVGLDPRDDSYGIDLYSYGVQLPDSIDFRNVHSRKIEIKGADTVMTFDGNNEISIETKVDGYQGTMQVYLRVCNEQKYNDCVAFANEKSSKHIYIGTFISDNRVKSSIAPRALPSAAQKQNAPFVQRERHNAIIRDGERRYKANGAGIR